MSQLLSRHLVAVCLLVFPSFHQTSSQYFEPKIGNSIDITDGLFYNTTYETKCNAYSYFSVNFIYPCKDLVLSIRPSKGQPNVYVSKAYKDGGDPYPTREKMTWAAHKDDLYTLIIYRYDPDASPGYYYIGVYNDCSQQSEIAAYQIEVLPSVDPPVSLYSTDILEFPYLSMNKFVASNKYQFFRFCLPVCANVKVTLENCIDIKSCPQTYSFPELLISREKLLPSLQDYSYKLASSKRRDIWVNHTDPSGRNSNGYIQGAFYVAVFGYCTPQQYVRDNATDGPCKFAKNTKFNVTVTIYPIVGSSQYGECPEETRALMLPVAPSYPSIQTGAPVAASVPCGGYTYYSLAVPNPCTDLHIKVKTSGGSELDVAELAVGKYPNVKPTFNNLQWTSYDHGSQDLIISALDPAFRGGDRCGPDGASQCLMYIGVTGYCALPGATRVNFTLSATLVPVTTNVFQAPLTNQIVTAKGEKKYVFCVDSAANVVAQMTSFTSACECPSSYANYAATISKSTPDATQQDLTWKMGGSRNETASVQLMASDKNTRPGVYYLTVFGNCGSASDCRGSECTCAPCTNVANSPYALYVGTAADFTAGKSSAASLGTCAVAGVASGQYGRCSSTCPFTATSTVPTSQFDNVVTQGVRAMAAIAAALLILGILGCFCSYKRQRTSSDKNMFVPLPGESNDPFIEMTGPETASE